MPIYRSIAPSAPEPSIGSQSPPLDSPLLTFIAQHRLLRILQHSIIIQAVSSGTGLIYWLSILFSIQHKLFVLTFKARHRTAHPIFLPLFPEISLPMTCNLPVLSLSAAKENRFHPYCPLCQELSSWIPMWRCLFQFLQIPPFQRRDLKSSAPIQRKPEGWKRQMSRRSATRSTQHFYFN